MRQTATATAAEKLEELRLPIDASIPFNLDSMFPKRKGWGSTAEIKRKHKVVTSISPFLKRVLREGEEVLYVAQGVQYKFSEQYFLGIWAAFINQTVFVLTNLRIIMIHSDTKGRPKHTYWMIFYNQIKQMKPSWAGHIQLRLVDGLKLNFTGFRGTDRQQMPAIFQEALATYRELGFDPQSSQSLENLCSRCLQPVRKKHYECAACGQRYWKPSQIAVRSLVFPSWGDFVMRHYGLAAVELLGYVISWGVIISLVLSAEDAGELVIAAIIAGFVLGVEHIIDGALTYFIAKKGLVPRGSLPA